MTEYWIPLAMVGGGLVVLIFGGEMLVRGAVAVAAALRVSPLLIGLTVVAFATSAPELAVSVVASYAGQPDLAMGNVVGSNIFNTLLILGLSALVVPLVVSSRLVRLDVPLMIAASLLVLALGWDGRIGRLEGLLLFTGLLAYLGWSVVTARKESVEVTEQIARQQPQPSRMRGVALAMQLGKIVLGVGLLVLGSHWLVSGSTTLAQWAGISERVIGLTILATGTSLPEVAASLVASLRGQRDIAVGNVVGSNLFNILGVLGLTAVVSADGVQVSTPALRLDIPVMIAAAVACLPIFFTGRMITRWEGALLLAGYLAYVSYLIVGAVGPVG